MQSNGSTSLYQWAKQYWDAGLSVIPLRHGRAPLKGVKHSKYHHNRCTVEELETWFHDPHVEGIGILGGPGSGNLEILDFDQEPAYEQFREKLDPKLFARFAVAKSPKGYHLYYRVHGAETGRETVRDAAGDEIVSIRGIAYYVVAPGSLRKIYEKIPGGADYLWTSGDFEKIPVIGKPDREKIWSAVKSLGFSKETTPAKPDRVDLESVLDEDGNIPHGKAHNYLRGLAFSLARRTKFPSPRDYHDILAHVSQVAERCLAPDGKTKKDVDQFYLVGLVQSAIDKDLKIREQEREGSDVAVPLAIPNWIRPDEAEDEPDPQMLWDGGLAPGWITLLTGAPKLGKTTMVGHLIRAMQEGAAFLNQFTAKTEGIVITSEESMSDWKRRIDEVGIDGSRIRVDAAPILPKSWRHWEHYWSQAVNVEGVELVIVDALANFSPANENDQNELPRALSVLRQLTARHIAVLIMHHTGRVDQSRARGSTSLDGFVDMIWNLQRVGKGEKDNRRRLTIKGRYSKVPPSLDFSINQFGELIVPANQTRFVKRERKDVIIEALDGRGPEDALGTSEIAKLIELDRSATQKQLTQLVDQGYLQRVKVSREFYYFDTYWNPL